LLLLTFVLGLAAWTAPVEPEQPDPHAVIRGMTISCPGAGRIWGSDAMVASMAQLRDMGVNWIAIHPYAGIRGDGQVGSGRIDGLYADPTWLTRPIAEAHRLGLKIMIKPHIAYWGSPFSWRGEIRFETEAEWDRFFDSYERWITMVAELSADADAFAVGTELGGTTHHEARWREIIAAVRQRTSAPLTYAANWDAYERVAFWDALDAIGIQSYFPLVTQPGVPSRAELERSWDRLIARLEAYGDEHDRDVVLAELGYNRSHLAAVRPWEYKQGGPDADEIQRRCMVAALEALGRSERVSGAFLWKWFPGERARGNFIMSTPAMREVIETQWGGGD
jgi:hypothetical protein